MPDFSNYQGSSDEWKAFVKANPLPAPGLALSPQALRAATNALRVKISQAELERDDLCSKVTWRDYSVLTRDQCNIIVRVYRPNHASTTAPLPVYLFFHGGGHLFGTIETEDAGCARVADRAGILVANVGYRHTPEFTHPTQVHDALDAFAWLGANIDAIGGDRTRVIVGGISAGACLAAVVAQQSCATNMGITICGQLLCIPWLVHPDNNANNTPASIPTSSYQQNTHADILPLGLMQLFSELLGASDYSDSTLNPGLADDAAVAGLPKTCFLVAGQDLLRDEGLSYAQKLAHNGIPVKVHVFPGMPHGFRRYSDLRASWRWDELLVEGCRWFLSSDKTSSGDIVVEMREDTQTRPSFSLA
ncbi:hypothetical protein SBRCBS47491_008706 [Sporothrix bragantina]|uniref:Alpha/beta hydrolase fold-3 domain-containing protein n=1 Tax=Sporothrix bragantina TaxID=671064 RepID=A0ABP0CQT9_9PEZI